MCVAGLLKPLTVNYYLFLALPALSLCRSYTFVLFQLLQKKKKITNSAQKTTLNYTPFYTVLTCLKEGNHFVNNVLQLSVGSTGKTEEESLKLNTDVDNRSLIPKSPEFIMKKKVKS